MGKASKDKRDAYYRLAKEQGWRARSAFKLLQLDEHFNLFENVTRVVDLCAAPGSWSQVLSRVLVQGEKFERVGVPGESESEVAGPDGNINNKNVNDNNDNHIDDRRGGNDDDDDDDDGSNAGANAGAGDSVRGGQVLTNRARSSATKHDDGASVSTGADANAGASSNEDGDRERKDEKNRKAGNPSTDVKPDTYAIPMATTTSNKSSKDDTTTPKDRREIKIVAIDLQPINPLKGITALQADITHPSTVPRLLAALDPDEYDLDYNYDPSGDSINYAPLSQTYHHHYEHKNQSYRRNPVDLVLCDGAPDVTGLHDFDAYVQRELVQSALDLAICVLRPGGTFVAKIFRVKDVDLLYAQLRKLFERVNVGKPRSSRMSSVEAFAVCQGFRGHQVEDNELELKESSKIPETWFGSTEALVYPRFKERSYSKKRFLGNGVIELELESGPPQSTSTATGTSSEDCVKDHAEERWTAPFISCGDPAAFDSDTSYRLPEGYVSLDPIQPPTAPPYKMAIEMRRAAGGAYGKTKNKKNNAKPKTEKTPDMEKG